MPRCLPAAVRMAGGGTLGVAIRLAERQTGRLALNGGDMTRLSPAELREEQKKTLAAPPLTYGFLAKILFMFMDLFYGRKRSWNKFKVLEIIARVPYQAWEQVAYIAITHSYEHRDFARRISDRVQEARHQP